MSDNPKPANVAMTPWILEEDSLDENLHGLANVTIRDRQNRHVVNVFDTAERARADAAFICEAVNYYVSQNPRVQIRRLRAERDKLRETVREVVRTCEHALGYMNAPGGQAAFCQVAPSDLRHILSICLGEPGGAGLAPAAPSAGKEGA